jgi:hypothetical protein
MCTGVEIALIGSAIVGTTAAIYSGQVQKETAEVNAELQRREGDAAKDAAVAQAEKIRKAARAQEGQANAALAASGVAIGEGTPIVINEKINQDAEEDAYNTLLTGSRQQRTAGDQAGLTRFQGQAAANASYLNAASTVLSTGASYGQWKTSQAKKVS